MPNGCERSLPKQSSEGNHLHDTTRRFQWQQQSHILIDQDPVWTGASQKGVEQAIWSGDDELGVHKGKVRCLCLPTEERWQDGGSNSVGWWLDFSHRHKEGDGWPMRWADEKVQYQGHWQTWIGYWNWDCMQLKEKSIALFQSNYINEVISRFLMQDCNPVSTPLNPSVTLTKYKGDKVIDKFLYSQAIRLLLYAAIATQPDISYAVQTLSQYSVNPRPEHWTAVKRIKRTKDHTLTFGGDNVKWGNKFTAFMDAYWVSNNDCRSISGYAFLLGGGVILWSLKKQSLITLSTTLHKQRVTEICHLTWVSDLGPNWDLHRMSSGWQVSVALTRW